MHRLKVFLGAAAFAWLAGCTSTASNQAGTVPEVEDRPAPAAEAGSDLAAVDTGAEDSGTTGTIEDAQSLSGIPLTDESGEELPLVIYFDLDVSEIHPDDRVVVEAHAQYLAREPEAEVVLEGHADERGSREYNVALGERRANGVRDMLRLLGVADHQIRTVSYGEERPAAVGHEEESWSRNRRVEFGYVAR